MGIWLRTVFAVLAVCGAPCLVSGEAPAALTAPAPRDPLGLDLREDDHRVLLDVTQFDQLQRILAVVPPRNEDDFRQLADLLKIPAHTPLQRQVYFESPAAKSRLVLIQDYLNKQYRLTLKLGKPGTDEPGTLLDYDLKTGAFTLTAALPGLEQVVFPLNKPSALAVEQARDAGTLTLVADLNFSRAPNTREVTPGFSTLSLYDEAGRVSWLIRPGSKSGVAALKPPPQPSAAQTREFRLKDGRSIRGELVMQVGEKIGIKDSTGKVIVLNVNELEQ